MRIDHEFRPGRLAFNFHLDDDEPAPAGRAVMGERRATIDLPRVQEAPHPDLLALAAWTLGSPFARSVHFDWPVSTAMVEALAGYYAKPLSVTALAGDVAPRTRPKVRNPGLAFSGGVDSLAVAVLIPDARLYHLHRAQLEGDVFVSDPKAEGARLISAAMAERGWPIDSIPTDLEFVRHPAGFPDQMACAVPMILHADLDDLDASTFGTIAEAAYRYGTDRFVDTSARPVLTRMDRAFTVAGIPYVLPVIGMSEIGTTRIVDASPYRALANSCATGRAEACGVCLKCVRKMVTSAALGASWPKADVVDRAFDDVRLRKRLSEEPIKLENVFAFAMAHYPGRHERLGALKARVVGDGVDLDWMNRYYAPSLEHTVADYRDSMRKALDQHLEPMSAADIEAMKAWSAKDALNTSEGQDRLARFRSAMGTTPPPQR